MKPYILLLMIIFSAFACTSDAEEDDDISLSPSNYVIVLDLSDRLSFQKRQSEEDKIVVLDILSIFTDKVKKAYIDSGENHDALKDKLKVVILPKTHPTVDYKQYEKKLSLNFEGSDENTIKYLLSRRFEDFYIETLNKLYSEVMAPGMKLPETANLWSFFNSGLAKELSTDPELFNYLFVVSDGYVGGKKHDSTLVKNNRYPSFSFKDELQRDGEWKMKFANEDYGLVKVGKTYSQLSVMLLEVEPESAKQSEMELISLVWQKWTSEMGVRNFKIAETDAVGQMRDEIYSFLQTPKINPEAIYAVEQETDKLIASSKDNAPSIDINAQETLQVNEEVVAKKQTIVETSNPVNPAAEAEEIIKEEPAPIQSANTSVKPKNTNPPKEAKETATEQDFTETTNVESTGPARVYSSISLSTHLNKISERSTPADKKEQLTQTILNACLNPDVSVKLISDTNMVVDLYIVKNYLARIKLLGKYKIEVVELEKNSSDRITEIVLRESRL